MCYAFNDVLFTRQTKHRIPACLPKWKGKSLDLSFKKKKTRVAHVGVKQHVYLFFKYFFSLIFLNNIYFAPGNFYSFCLKARDVFFWVGGVLWEYIKSYRSLSAIEIIYTQSHSSRISWILPLIEFLEKPPISRCYWRLD